LREKKSNSSPVAIFDQRRRRNRGREKKKTELQTVGKKWGYPPKPNRSEGFPDILIGCPLERRGGETTRFNGLSIKSGAAGDQSIGKRTGKKQHAREGQKIQRRGGGKKKEKSFEVSRPRWSVYSGGGNSKCFRRKGKGAIGKRGIFS